MYKKGDQVDVFFFGLRSVGTWHRGTVVESNLNATRVQVPLSDGQKFICTVASQDVDLYIRPA